MVSAPGWRPYLASLLRGRVSAQATRFVAQALHRRSIFGSARAAPSGSARADRAPQQIERALAREIRSGRVERSAAVAVEAVLRALVDEDFGVLAAGECAPDLVDCGHRNSVVLGAEVKLNRALHRVRLAQKTVYSAAVVA